jgi:hypothetical protein
MIMHPLTYRHGTASLPPDEQSTVPGIELSPSRSIIHACVRALIRVISIRPFRFYFRCVFVRPPSIPI